jgi:hypothetical protein
VGEASCASADTKLHVTTKSRKKIKIQKTPSKKIVPVCSFEKAIGKTKSQPKAVITLENIQIRRYP